jgi:hypothetical protein
MPFIVDVDAWWPLGRDRQEKWAAAEVGAGHRLITYGRRSFGRSSKRGVGDPSYG